MLGGGLGAVGSILGQDGEYFGSGWSSGMRWLSGVMEEGERAAGDVLQHGPALLWGRESLWGSWWDLGRRKSSKD